MGKPILNLNMFNSLSIQEQVKEVNEVLSSGTSLNQFGKSIGIDEGGIRKRFKKAGYSRSRTGKKLFEAVEGVATSEKASEDIGISKGNNTSNKQKEAVQKANKQPKNDINIELLYKQFENMQKELNAVKKEILELKKETPKEQQHQLKVKEFKTDLKQISYRYNLEVLENLDKLCKQYPQYSKTLILNSLLDETLEKYLK